MDARGADHVVDEGQLVSHIAESRDRLTEQFAAAAVGLEFPDWLEPRSQAILKGLNRLTEVALLAMVFDQGWLVVKQIDVAGGTRHEQLHHPLDLGRIDTGRVQRPACSGRGRQRLPLPGQHRR